MGMTIDDFNYGLMACGCLWHNGKTWFEKEELIQCFKDLGLITEDEKDENDNR